ncbi:hypothetical protein [Thermoflexibacter ruber]|uniref:Preprotein translocase subunit SecB n=1 Tax=Thermoflexibacter ruber TaxID=1003 RepID=A0A1I2AK78_9BACT|nr:hypothetical protein [Thermoflexibacter ruber]SFE43353.1 hypothetical protein SAMN04488541_1001172 [Thermoflexibacter ruber]
MLDNNHIFDPENITIVEFKIVKSQVEVPEDFDAEKVEGHYLDNSLQLGFNIDEKLVKTDFTIEIRTKSKGQNPKEATGNFHLVFIYHVENLQELAKLDTNNLIELHPDLANALSSVTYSTARGILLTRFQGTALQNFVLPIINPTKLLYNK